jgi:hypothetical protein
VALKFDTSRFRVRLERLKGVPEAVNEELRDCAHDLAQLSRDMAPIDYGDLKAAIKVGRRGVQGEGGRFVAGKSQYDVYVDEDQPVRDPDKIDEGVETVGEYAMEVHEHMGWESHPVKDFMPSEKSRREGAARGVEAGGKFMERALIELSPGIVSRLKRKFESVIGMLGK